MPQDFLKVECEECGNKQIIYSRPANDVKCLVCNTEIAESTGGKAELNGRVIAELQPE